jgi:hypothetical protein
MNINEHKTEITHIPTYIINYISRDTVEHKCEITHIKKSFFLLGECCFMTGFCVYLDLR